MREEIIKLLDQYRLKEALSQMTGYATHTSDWQLKNELEALQTSYDLMLQYTSKGMKDPNKVEIYHKMLRTAYELADRIHIAVQATQNYGAYYDTMRTFVQSPPHSYAELQMQLEAYTEDMATAPLIYTTEAKRNEEMDAMRKRHETAVDELFEKIWVSTRWSESEYAEAQTLFNSLLIQVNDLSIMVSAVTMSLLQIFDIRKFMFLLNAYTHQDTMLNQRAIAGIALTCYYYEKRILQYPEAVSRINELNENAEFIKNLHHIQIQLLQSSRETRKIDKKMREEIIPEMMKNVTIMRNMKYGFEENIDEDDRNPDWEKAFEESGLGDKIREMNELQLEGADVYMSTFAQLKSYPFFQNPHNWFYPFDMQHSSIIREFGLKPTGENAVLSLILQSGFFCNSDKYSLCFTMAHIPQAQRNMMLSQMTSQDLNELLDESKSSSLRQYALRPDVISNQYIHDLYRFFKLSQRRHEYRDIFKEEIALHRIPALKDILCKPELLATIADFHFRKEHPAEALSIYKEITDMNHADAEIFQKTGYCLQKEKRYKEAIEAYRKADVLNPDHVWTIRHLATCHRQLRDFATALEYYRKAEAMQPENRNLPFLIGSCLAEQERYEEALQCFFKLDFMENDCIKAWRAIGWGSFVSGKIEQAMRYYNKILALKPLSTDYLNAGHAALLLGNMEKAAELYGKATSESGNRETFLEMFDKDKEMLIKLGVDENDIPLIRDFGLTAD